MSVSEMPTRDVLIAAMERFYTAEGGFFTGAHDFGPVADLLHRDVVVFEPDSLPYGGEWRGHDGFERLLSAMQETWSSISAQDAHYVVDGETVIVLVTMVAEAAGTKRIARNAISELVRFRDGLISEVRPFYWDTAAVNRALDHRLA